MQSWEGESAEATTTTAGVTGCEKVPFAPALTASSETSEYDEPDGVTVAATVPQDGLVASADVADARLLLPTGLTLDLPAMGALQSCTAAQAAIAQTGSFACPAASRIAAATIEAPFLSEALSGGVYLAAAGGEPVAGGSALKPEYPVYLDVQSARDGVQLRLAGSITPGHAGGRVEMTSPERRNCRSVRSR